VTIGLVDDRGPDRPRAETARATASCDLSRRASRRHRRVRDAGPSGPRGPRRGPV